MELYSYKLTNDSGFAPNPFFGVLTLATCKPGIRRGKDQGDWIAGFTSIKLCKKGLCKERVGEERLIFLMEVTERIPQFEYYGNKRFKMKIPNLRRKDFVYKAGDNIYRPQKKNPKHPNDFEQKKNPNHWDFVNDSENRKQRKHDLSGQNVLISTNFYYFGRCAIQIPNKIRPAVPKYQTNYGERTYDTQLAIGFIDFIVNNCRKGILCAPHKWPENDISWNC